MPAPQLGLRHLLSPASTSSPTRESLRPALCGALAVLLPAFALGQATSPSYQLPRQSIDGGAGRASSASYTLQGTPGQPEVGPTMTQANYTLRGGFHRIGERSDRIFADGFEEP